MNTRKCTFDELPDYRQMIIDTVGTIDNTDLLEFVYNTLVSFRKKCGYGMHYKSMIVAILEHIDNDRFLKRIYISLREYTRESEVSA